MKNQSKCSECTLNGVLCLRSGRDLLLYNIVSYGGFMKNANE